MADIQKEYRPVYERALEQGWREKACKSGRQLLSPDGEHVVTLHRSQSDHRGVANFVRDLKRGGFRAH